MEFKKLQLLKMDVLLDVKKKEAVILQLAYKSSQEESKNTIFKT